MDRTELEWCQRSIREEVAVTLDTWHVKRAIVCENLGNNFLRDRDSR